MSGPGPHALASVLLCACAAPVDVEAHSDSGRPGPGDASASDSAEARPAPPCIVPEVGQGLANPSFVDEVFPLLNAGCAGFACHNDAFRTRGLFLGPSPDEYEPTDATLAEVHASLRARAETAPRLARVDPGAPETSFLMFKVDGCQATLAAECPSTPANKPCGDSMPLASPLWPPEKRALLRAWIAAGAAGP